MNLNMLKITAGVLQSATLGVKTSVGGVFKIGGAILDPTLKIAGTEGKYLDFGVTGLLTAKGLLDTLGEVQAGMFTANNLSAKDTISQHVQFGRDYAISTGLAAVSNLLPSKFKIAARIGSLALSAKTAAHSRLLDAAEETRLGDPLGEASIAGRSLFKSYVPGVGIYKNFFLADWLGLGKFAQRDQELGLASHEKVYLNQTHRVSKFIDDNGVGENPFEWLLHPGKSTALDEHA